MLAVTFVCVTVATLAFLWAMAVLVQPFFFSEIVDRLPLRSAVGGLLLGCFITLWVYANTRADRPDKYGTFFEFNPTGTKTFDSFTATRRLATKKADGTWPEQTVAVKRVGKTNDFIEAGSNPPREFRLNSSSYMTVAITVDEADGKKAKFDAELNPAGTSYLTPAKVFREVGGSRFLEGENVGLVYAPSTSAVIVAIFLNAMLYIVLLVVFWPVMRYGMGLSLGFAAGFGLAIMLTALPLLFELNQKRPADVLPPAVGRP